MVCHSYKAYNFIRDMILYAFRGDKPCRFIQKCRKYRVDNYCTLTTEYQGIRDVRICGAAKKMRQDISALCLQSDSEEVQFLY